MGKPRPTHDLQDIYARLDALEDALEATSGAVANATTLEGLQADLAVLPRMWKVVNQLKKDVGVAQTVAQRLAVAWRRSAASRVAAAICKGRREAAEGR